VDDARLPATLSELVEVLAGLADLPPIERASISRRLDNVARAILGEVGDAAVYEATRATTHAEVATALGVTPSRVNGAITRYHQRHRIVLPRGRPRRG